MVVPTFKFQAGAAEGGWIRAYDYGWCGAEGIVGGLREVLEAGGQKTVTWVIADHNNKGDACHKVLTIGLAPVDGVVKFRYCTNGDPRGAGSSTLYAAKDFAEAVAVFALNMAPGPDRWLYRQPAKLTMDWDADGTIIA